MVMEPWKGDERDWSSPKFPTACIKYSLSRRSNSYHAENALVSGRRPMNGTTPRETSRFVTGVEHSTQTSGGLPAVILNGTSPKKIESAVKEGLDMVMAGRPGWQKGKSLSALTMVIAVIRHPACPGWTHRASSLCCGNFDRLG
jgi:hypothetical protein